MPELLPGEEDAIATGDLGAMAGGLQVQALPQDGRSDSGGPGASICVRESAMITGEQPLSRETRRSSVCIR